MDGDDQVSSTDNAEQVFSVEDTEVPPKTSKQGIVKPSQTSTGDMKPTTSSQALQTRSSEVEIISNLPCTDARDRKLYPEKAASAGHCEDPIDESSCPHIQRKYMPSDHYEKELIKPKTKKPKLHLGPVSSCFKGNYHDSIYNSMSLTLVVLFCFVLFFAFASIMIQISFS